MRARGCCVLLEKPLVVGAVLWGTRHISYYCVVGYIGIYVGGQIQCQFPSLNLGTCYLVSPAPAWPRVRTPVLWSLGTMYVCLVVNHCDQAPSGVTKSWSTLVYGRGIRSSKAVTWPVISGSPGQSLRWRRGQPQETCHLPSRNSRCDETGAVVP